MPKSDAINYTCNHCAVGVTEATHERHMKLLEMIFAESGHYGGFDASDLFVHERGNIQSFDVEGNVVVCDKCFIVELSDNLIYRGETSGEATEEGYEAFKAAHR